MKFKIGIDIIISYFKIKNKNENKKRKPFSDFRFRKRVNNYDSNRIKSNKINHRLSFLIHRL